MKLRRVTEPRAFTQRELEVMGLMAKGKSNKEIAAELGVGFSAVHHHQYTKA